MPRHTHVLSISVLQPAQQRLINADNKRLAGAEHACHVHEAIQDLAFHMARAYKRHLTAAAASMSATDVEIVTIQVFCFMHCFPLPCRLCSSFECKQGFHREVQYLIQWALRCRQAFAIAEALSYMGF